VISSSRSIFTAAVLDEVLKQRQHVAAEHLARVRRHELGISTAPNTSTPLASTISPGLVRAQFPPVSAARSTITVPGRMSATIASVMSLGAGARDLGRRDDEIDLLEVIVQQRGGSLLLFAPTAQRA
jgi:hypothetical protein